MFSLKRINRSALARKVGFTQSGVSRIFSGQREPNISTVYMLAKALDIRVDYLIEALLIEGSKYRKKRVSQESSDGSTYPVPKQ